MTPQFKELRHAYGFDDVAIVPGSVTANPDQTDIRLSVRDHTFSLPILASAMDGIVSPSFAILFGKLGGLAVLNLEGVYSRYEDPSEPMSRILAAPQEECTELLQEIYAVPLQERLLAQRVEEMKAGGITVAVSVTPQNTKRLAPVAVEAGTDIIVVQSTVTTARHISKSYRGLLFDELVEQISVPVIVGNCVSYDVALELMETGVEALLVGVGPGAVCTTREVVGVGVPQVSATLEVAAARQEFWQRTGRYVSVITDGGIRTGGDLCKAIASGADAVMLGTPFAQAQEAPGQGFNWGMASPHPALPRGTRAKVGVKGSLETILFGPTTLTDGTQNLVGALRAGMGMVGALTVQEMQQAEMIVAPAIKTEGKVFQLARAGARS